MQFFYAVRVGKRPGIYRTWEECSEQVKGFPGTKYKKFKTIEEAQQFINGEEIPAPKPKSKAGAFGSQQDTAQSSTYSRTQPFPSRPQPYSVPTNKDGSRSYSTFRGTQHRRTYSTMTTLPKYDGSPILEIFPQDVFSNALSDSANHKRVTVYTDGCCHSNGQSSAVAGIGVYWGDGSPHNISEPLAGRPTNNRAEIHAAVRAIQQAKSMGMSGVNIITDSQFLINSTTLWMPKWRQNNWKSYSGKPVINKEDFEELVLAMEGIEVEWTHVRGHQGIHGNEEADKLANEGARKSVISWGHS